MNLINLWIFYVGGYVVAYSIKGWADEKRGQPFEDPELMNRKNVLYPALLWILTGLIITIFTPIGTGIQLIIGLVVLAIGMIIVIISFYSFAMQSGLTVSRIHKISRNPNYIGWNIFMGGLAIIGWSNSIWSYVCLGYFFYTVIYLHFTILTEERFLSEKYGEEYQNYSKKVPRYFLGI